MFFIILTIDLFQHLKICNTGLWTLKSRMVLKALISNSLQFSFYNDFYIESIKKEKYPLHSI